HQFELDREQHHRELDQLRAEQRQIGEQLAQNRIDQARIQEASDKLQSEEAARKNDLEAREAKLAEQLAALEHLQSRQDSSLDDARSQVDAETEQLRAACELLENERRQFLEEKERWQAEQTPAPGTVQAPPSSPREETSGHEEQACSPDESSADST